MTAAPPDAIRLETVTHRYGKVLALDGLSVALPAGKMIAMIGPDGVGKSTLLGLVAGARRRQQGRIEVLGGDMADPRHRMRACPRIAYMPQGLGRNLNMDLSVRENLEFFSRLFDQGHAERVLRIEQLLRATGLTPFAARPAGKLSGGMKQKLGLCCALIHDPDLLILDEPTTGVDPLSRRQFWELIDEIRRSRTGLTVLIATAYMDEAERFDHLIAMNAGRILAEGTPAEVRQRTGSASLEAAFIALLPEAARAGYRPVVLRPREHGDGEPAILAEGLTRRFGDFTAVDRVSFRIERGEIFGFLGSNGCGKTTTMKMLTGLLPPTAGSVELFGKVPRPDDLATRRRVGYMSQSFSLYAELTVRQNLELHARLFQVPAGKMAQSIKRLFDEFGLEDHADELAEQLPLGVRQRLSLAVAVIHEPELLILDEPTSGVDPVARDKFWELLIGLSRDRGVTIFISTHFMNEAARCDRISLMHAGRVLETDTPTGLVAKAGSDSLEAAFIHYLQDAAKADAAKAGPAATPPVADPPPAMPAPPAAGRGGLSLFKPRRLFAYALRETLEILRDPVRLAVALFGTALLMLVFGYGITFDVENLSYATLDRDRTPESRTYLENYAGSRYFDQKAPLADDADLDRRLKDGEITLAIEIPPDFGKDILRDQTADVAVWIDGAMPFRAETIRGYVEGLHLGYLQNLGREKTGETPSVTPYDLEPRYRYNQDFRSVYAMVPGVVALLLLFIPAILMALGIVREKELGSITNLYVTPVTRLEFLVGKQVPYVILGMANFLLMTAMALIVFGVPIKGSFATLSLGAFLYLLASTALGLLISAFTRSQIAALFATAIITMLPAVQFSGMMQPVSSLEGNAAFLGTIFPTTYFFQVSVGVFTKALSFRDLASQLGALALFFPILLILSAILLPKQER
ncbi:MAG TPA: ribosome-associated ATPase/putative transporter RbbA [Hypericibacter adhaerens]|jgi:ribosome-dependent ATPase|uniref:ABC transporter ATP-binding protein/permease n=1 Tax=Hypericibacter adhaerens TaxID=2602016 RepID=A0A5J6N0S1_9PROT|nr:ribosome-associated ATPase/putative transporter RbbA [Hypericibacter adhaerens]QEX20486.1 ABC transporter ATP-binding protein/permease [Hypericibacter adhaerens]HWA46131.1 ribosome-associated ATPase/putative transporter RbbA [Hypericibacter adhaerens]